MVAAFSMLKGTSSLRNFVNCALVAYYKRQLRCLLVHSAEMGDKIEKKRRENDSITAVSQKKKTIVMHSPFM